MKIQVKQELIEKGVRKSPWYCPTSLAIREALGIPDEDAEKVCMASTYMEIYGKIYHEDSYECLRYPLKAVRAYDDTGYMMPFEFELPEEVRNGKESET